MDIPEGFDGCSGVRQCYSMSSLQADWLPGSVSTGNRILLDWEHRITAFQPRGDLQGNFLPPLPFVGEEAEAYWRSSMASNPAGTRAQFSCPLSLSVAHTSRLAGCARSGHLYLEAPHRHGMFNLSKPNSPSPTAPSPGFSVSVDGLLSRASQKRGRLMDPAPRPAYVLDHVINSQDSSFFPSRIFLSSLVLFHFCSDS